MLKNFRESAFWQIFMLLASGFVLIAIVFDYLFYATEPELIYLFRAGDSFCCIIFFIDFIFSIKENRHKKSFYKLAWVDLLASVPNFNAFMPWFFQLCKLIRVARSALRLISYFFLGKERALMSIAASLLFSSVLISSILVLNIEKDLANANIHNLQDSLWWAISTVTTVGYGDNFPVSLNGRIVGVFLMFIGITLFSMLSALILSWLLTSIVKNEDDTSREDISKTVKDIKELINKKLP